MSEILPFPSQKGEGRGDVVQCLIVRGPNVNKNCNKLLILKFNNTLKTLLSYLSFYFTLVNY